MSVHYEKLKQLVEAAADDIAKANKGNKAATTRVRKQMQDIKACCQDVRKEMMGMRDKSEDS